ncbi:cytosolic Fe-S cluster assembly factor [Polychytrium aggregatum]|uniref:cytosolic Fe-S cluster assembly factor n=1 Tax=Polychytrium aggregatum TaxID=110093 RepID=UPI0022FE7CD3|nr:cytosolic Fe-S cluster assembly factor [Polychytrium aggregatum]KAI9190740.1 cytosolic Fe-S cluster assembly factor [Polychytrium aggregatum]
MSGNFSGALVLTDLNDYIQPSQACILPVPSARAPSGPASSSADDSGTARTEIRIDNTGSYHEVSLSDGSSTKLEEASITLNDCLACSGCITSAESVLITMQSHNELYSVLTENKKALQENRPHDIRTIVISLSPQSRASIAAKHSILPLQTHRRLTAFFKSLGCHYVFDTAFSRDFSLVECSREFVRRFKESQLASGSSSGVLPMLSSACPGWICYAEKTHGYIIPNIDTTKSPQQIMGSIVKDFFAERLGVPSNKIYHVSVMPCYDKKLEASREDFYSDVMRTRDVDCVITTGEVELLLKEQGITDLSLVPEVPLEPVFTKASQSPDGTLALLHSTEGSSSGGYLSYVLRYAAKELFGHILTPVDVAMGTNGVEIKPGRNLDFVEVCLNLPERGGVVLRFVAAYGFRNIQNLVRKVKPAAAGRTAGGAARRVRGSSSQSEFHFVEVMACPSGCINGGGQLKPESHTSSQLADENQAATNGVGASRSWVAHVEEVYRSVGTGEGGIQMPEENAAVVELYRAWLGGPDSTKARQMLHTQYRAIEKNDINPLAVKW